MHNNLTMLDEFDMDMYIISHDTPEQQKELYSQLKDYFGTSLPFISDPDMKLIEQFGMKNGDVAYRGFGIMDQNGEIIFKKVNDHWGEQIDHTVQDIEKEYKKIK
ncbi:peroxiredoxin family protein [Cytobacillus depressus]|uniref:Peroxiredoxin family protein n=1 Tax=Cytobacillus depressus TaxID=1602942 RepID=A0A6L3V222_9BACI|nr:peroxiredoxin family protein [Cytobacillus depressus]